MPAHGLALALAGGGDVGVGSSCGQDDGESGFGGLSATACTSHLKTDVKRREAAENDGRETQSKEGGTERGSVGRTARYGVRGSFGSGSKFGGLQASSGARGSGMRVAGVDGGSSSGTRADRAGGGKL